MEAQLSSLSTRHPAVSLGPGDVGHDTSGSVTASERHVDSDFAFESAMPLFGKSRTIPTGAPAATPLQQHDRDGLVACVDEVRTVNYVNTE